MDRASIIMIGGFLGAGKTTAIIRLAEHLKARGLRVGLITNDQSHGLVDTRLAGANTQLPIEEVAGGCFCCRFNSLVEAARRLSEDQVPDVFLAEPVGSCTDLRATVSVPLRRLYGESYRIAPLSVLVDPIRARRILGLDSTKSFSSKVIYVYEKQLEESELILINKRELLDEAQLLELEGALAARYPDRPVLSVSARHGLGLDDWFARLLEGESADEASMEVDYRLYAEGEALLGWLNASFQLRSDAAFDGNAVLEELAAELQERIAPREVAHLKMTLEPDEFATDLGVINLVRSDSAPELSHSLADVLERGALTVNMRAECDPEDLADALDGAIERCLSRRGIAAERGHCERFRPAAPVPTHRMATSPGGRS